MAYNFSGKQTGLHKKHPVEFDGGAHCEGSPEQKHI